MSSPDLKTYHGNCHCGAFKFHITMPEITTATECNCSICFKKGYKWIFPGEGGFVIDKGEGTLRDYEFGPVTMSHRFCPKCGTGVMGKRHGVPAGREIGVNAKTLMNVDVLDLKVQNYDGKGLTPTYSPPTFAGKLPEPTVEIVDPKLYTGSCHCGAVTVALIAKGPLPAKSEEIQECDCSICVRNGTTLIYPHHSQVSIAGAENLTPYLFGRKFVSHDFCKTCGVAVQLKKIDVGEERWKVEHPGSDYSNHMLDLPLNLRIFEGVEWEELQPIRRGSWSKREPLYVCPE